MEVKADELINAIRWRLGIFTDANIARYEEIWNKLGPWLAEDTGKDAVRLTGLLRKALEEPKQPVSVPARVSSSSSAPAIAAAQSPGGDMQPRTSNSQWVYRPVPDQEPLAHAEYDTATLVTPEGYSLLGARVRGKKHKHEGTNCDDWFEIATAGDWTLIAVADGAGSYKYSRIGARVSCQRAVKVLSEDLNMLHLSERLTADGFTARGEDGSFLDADGAAIQSILHKAFREAAAVVDKNAAILGRELGQAITPNDLSATLLLAVHTTLLVAGERQSLVVACQIGDGVIAAVGADGAVTLLGQADSGAYSGETEFLTSRRLLDAASLPRRTFALVGAPRALLVMTDGVGDDYFPADPGMARLYADLVLNGILLADCGGETPAAPDQTPAVKNCDVEAEALTAAGPEPLLLRSAALYAAAAQMDVGRLAAHPDLLLAGARGASLTAKPLSAEERLRRWLDAYHVRGSFDDRTLVVLDRERG